MPINWVPIHMQQQAAGGGGGGGSNYQAQAQAVAHNDQMIMEQMRMSHQADQFAASREVSPRDAWMQQQQAEGEERRAHLDAELYGARLSMQEQMEMGRRRNALSVIDNHPGLNNDERNDLRFQILTGGGQGGLRPMELRAQRAHQALQQQQLETAQLQHRILVANAVQAGIVQAQSLGDTATVQYDQHMMAQFQARIESENPGLQPQQIRSMAQAMTADAGGATQVTVNPRTGQVTPMFRSGQGPIGEFAGGGAGGGGQRTNSGGGGSGGTQQSASRDAQTINDLITRHDREWPQIQAGMADWDSLTAEQKAARRNQHRSGWVRERTDTIRDLMGENRPPPPRAVHSVDQLPVAERRNVEQFDRDGQTGLDLMQDAFVRAGLPANPSPQQQRQFLQTLAMNPEGAAQYQTGREMSEIALRLRRMALGYGGRFNPETAERERYDTLRRRLQELSEAQRGRRRQGLDQWTGASANDRQPQGPPPAAAPAPGGAPAPAAAPAPAPAAAPQQLGTIGHIGRGMNILGSRIMRPIPQHLRDAGILE